MGNNSETWGKQLTVRVKPNTNNKAKWYYGHIMADHDMTGQTVQVWDDQGEKSLFPDSYRYTGSRYIGKDDCEIIKIHHDTKSIWT